MGFSTLEYIAAVGLYKQPQSPVCCGPAECETPVFTVKSLSQNGFSHFGLFQQDVAGSILPCFNLAMMCVAQLLSSPLPNFWSFHL